MIACKVVAGASLILFDPSAIGRGDGLKIGQNCQWIVLKNCQHGEGGCQKSRRTVDVVYGMVRYVDLVHYLVASFFFNLYVGGHLMI